MKAAEQGKRFVFVGTGHRRGQADVGYEGEMEGHLGQTSANKAAHLLAREGVANNLCKVWLHVPSDCILHVVSDEIPAWEV